MKRLRQSGLAVFSRHGFDGASTKMVAEHAGVNEALISRYFGGKAGLLNAIILQSARELDTKASAYPAGRRHRGRKQKPGVHQAPAVEGTALSYFA